MRHDRHQMQFDQIVTNDELLFVPELREKSMCACGVSSRH